jgi:hypothetical protein
MVSALSESARVSKKSSHHRFSKQPAPQLELSTLDTDDKRFLEMPYIILGRHVEPRPTDPAMAFTIRRKVFDQIPDFLATSPQQRCRGARPRAANLET